MRYVLSILTTVLCFSVFAEGFESGSCAILCKIDKSSGTMTVMGKTDHKLKKSVHVLHWNSRTHFRKIQTVPFSTLKQGQIVWLHLDSKEAAKVRQGKEFVCRNIDIETERSSRLGFRSSLKLCAPVYPGKGQHGKIEYAGKKIKFKAPISVTVYTNAVIDDLKPGMLLRIRGTVSEKKFNISDIVILPSTGE